MLNSSTVYELTCGPRLLSLYWKKCPSSVFNELQKEESKCPKLYHYCWDWQSPPEPYLLRGKYKQTAFPGRPLTPDAFEASTENCNEVINEEESTRVMWSMKRPFFHGIMTFVIKRMSLHWPVCGCEAVRANACWLYIIWVCVQVRDCTVYC